MCSNNYVTMAAMAGMMLTLGATLSEPTIPLVPKLRDEKTTKVTISNYVNAGTVANPHFEKHKATVPLCNTEDTKHLLCTVVAFVDICPQQLLHLSTGLVHIEKFREYLGGNV